MTDWSQRVVLVTGASSGLGVHLCRAYAGAGARVALVARDLSRLEATLAVLNLPPEQAAVFACDLTQAEQVRALLEQVRVRFGRLDLLVNCAGLSARGRIVETAPAEFQRLWELNVLAVVHCVQAALPLLRESRGQIVNIGSLAGKGAARYLGAYPTTKFAVSGLTQQLRLELADDGINVMLVCPGPIARDDGGRRYDTQIENTGGKLPAPPSSLPESARRPGGGVKLKGIDPAWLAEKIVAASAARKPELIVPWKARLLFAIGQLSASWGDWLLRKNT